MTNPMTTQTANTNQPTLEEIGRVYAKRDGWPSDYWDVLFDGVPVGDILSVPGITRFTALADMPAGLDAMSGWRCEGESFHDVLCRVYERVREACGGDTPPMLGSPAFERAIRSIAEVA